MSTNILVVYKKNFEEVHDMALATVKSSLDRLVSENIVRVDYTARETVRRADFDGPDLVIVLGGDGTLTSIAHSVDDETPIMGVNSHPRMNDSDGSYGFYMGSDPDNFEEDIRTVVSGGAIVNVLPRLQAEIVTTSGNRIRTDPALNDLLVANTHQYQPSKYNIQISSDVSKEPINIAQQSSGCLFSTFLGQGAWFRHVANIEGTTFPLEEIDDHYLFVARDLPRGDRRDDGSYWSWTDKPTLMTSDMHRGYVVADGWDEFHFTRGATVSVDLDGPKLKLLTFRSTIYDRVAKWIHA
ncbi:MAG: NAD(+)/NADH kinase [Candidatus Thalassarchaeaceae archaeon]|nr:NAD(+)/NADH kinase [Candidatus Thalassarchaeaceae archaeon]|tara:strand:- start:2302 stop:3192 length:891 start_codon:yes stop_codon:yes gene_type:complete